MRTHQFLHHPHIDRSVMPIDARATKNPNLPMADCYSVGFRVSTQSQDSFVHAMVFADSFERLLYGIDQEKDAIRTQPTDQPILHIDVVYLRTMQTLDSDFISSETEEEVDELIQKTLIKRDDDHFVVFGIIGETKFVLLDMQTSDALTAISLARYKRIDAAPQEFTVLAVRQAHPIAGWFESMFQGAARRLSAIEDREPHGAGMTH